MSRLDLARSMPSPYWVVPPLDAIVAQGTQAWSTNQPPAANRVLYLPFRLPVTKLIKSISIWCSTSASATFDLGIYDGLLTARLQNMGATSLVGTSVNTWTLTTPFMAEAGVRYYVAMVFSSSSVTTIRQAVPVNSMRQAGAAQEASSTLPTTPTPAQIASANWPVAALNFVE